jgi:hypothetical protein
VPVPGESSTDAPRSRPVTVVPPNLAVFTSGIEPVEAGGVRKMRYLDVLSGLVAHAGETVTVSVAPVKSSIARDCPAPVPE